MISDEELGGFVKRHHKVHDAETVLERVLTKVSCCPYCHELFLKREQLEGHIKQKHASGLKSIEHEIEEHKVDPESTRILICTFCGYAIDYGGWPPATTRILNHVESCKEYKKLASMEDVHKSWRFSDDKELIHAYKEGHVKIQGFECSFCRDTYSSLKRLVFHIGRKHADRVDQLRKDEREELVNRIEACITKRGGPGNSTEREPDPDLSTDLQIGEECEKTISEQEIGEGYCDVPPRLRRALGQVREVRTESGAHSDEKLQYEPQQGRLLGLEAWYLGNAVEPSDKVLFRLVAQSPARIRIWTDWEKDLLSLLNCPPENDKWQSLSIRDCLVLVLTRLGKSVHYRVLYAEVSLHRRLKAGSIIACLSKYKDIIFVQTGQGKWGLVGEGMQRSPERTRPPVSRQPAEEKTRLSEDWLKTVEARHHWQRLSLQITAALSPRLELQWDMSEARKTLLCRLA